MNVLINVNIKTNKLEFGVSVGTTFSHTIDANYLVADCNNYYRSLHRLNRVGVYFVPSGQLWLLLCCSYCYGRVCLIQLFY